MALEFDHIILAHGELVDRDAHAVLADVWARPLSWDGG